MKGKWIWLVGPWVLFLALALGWTAYWFIVANTAERHIREWVSAQQAEGGSASVGRIVRHGFPTLMRLEMQDAGYAPARAGWRIDTGRADLHVNLLDPNHVTFEAKAPIAVSRADGAVTNVTAGALIATMRTQAGALAMAGVEADNLVLDDPAEEGQLRVRKLVINLRPDARATGDYQVSFDAQALTLPRPVRSFEAFGQDVATARAAMVVTQGPTLLHATPGDPLGPWRQSGGRVRFEALALDWGPLSATGAGEGGLDAQRRLDGWLRLPIQQPGPALGAIANGPNIDANARRALRAAAAGFVISGSNVTLNVEARDGWLRVERVPVRPLPPVY
jgi:hypothetical protein